jgi:hypothetical protein
MKARKAAIDSLLKFLHKSEAGRFTPPAPAPAPEAPQEDMSPETLDALQSLVSDKGE